MIFARSQQVNIKVKGKVNFQSIIMVQTLPKPCIFFFFLPIRNLSTLKMNDVSQRIVS